jgi:hypothetical protein
MIRRERQNLSRDHFRLALSPALQLAVRKISVLRDVRARRVLRGDDVQVVIPFREWCLHVTGESGNIHPR